MHKKPKYILTALSLWTATFAGGCGRSPAPKKLHVNIHGLYLGGYSVGNDKRFNQTIQFMKRNRLNAMVIDAKDDTGKISWQTDIPLAAEIGANSNKIKNIEARVRSLLASGIYPIARIVVFADPLLGSQKPEWSLHTRDGALFRDTRQIAWPSPHQQEVWKYNVDIAQRAARAGFKEIQFDYIRFPEKPIDGINFNVPLRPLSKAIEEFLKYAKRQLEPHGVSVGADVFGQTTRPNPKTGGYDYTIIGQDYARIAEIVDYVYPMVYPSHYAPGSYGVSDPNQNPDAIVRAALTDARKCTRHLNPNKHRPWIQDFSMGKKYTAADVEAQIKGLADAGVHQWILWNSRNRYTPGVRYGIADRP